MAKPTNGRSSSPSPSSNASDPSNGGQDNTSFPPRAPSSPPTSQPDDHTESIVEGDWVAITPSSVSGSQSPGDLSASMREAHDTVLVPRPFDRGTVDPEDEGEREGVRKTEDDTDAEVEANMVGKLAALLAGMGDSVRGEEEVTELVERELRDCGLELGMEREEDEEEDGKDSVKRRGK